MKPPQPARKVQVRKATDLARVGVPIRADSSQRSLFAFTLNYPPAATTFLDTSHQQKSRLGYRKHTMAILLSRHAKRMRCNAGKSSFHLRLGNSTYSPLIA